MTPIDEQIKKLKRARLRRLFQRDISLYAKRVLGVDLTPDQIDICRQLITHKKVIVLASHSVGKSFLAGVVINWFFDTFINSITISTAPTFRQVVNVTWKNVRKLRQRKGGRNLQPKAPRMEVDAGWYAEGMTAAKGDAFQGVHNDFLLMVFDEAIGVGRQFYEAAEGMMTSENSYVLMIGNPTDPTSVVKELAESGDYRVINLSCFTHPNIEDGLAGRKVRFPGAVTLSWLERAIRNWTTKISEEQRTATDFEWPPGSGNWFRPGPIFESRVIGRWPTSSTDSIWSDSLFASILDPQTPDMDQPLVVAVDVARYGDDFTTIMARRGRTVLHHETYNGNAITHTTGRVISVIKSLVHPNESPSSVPINIDDDGIGGGASDVLMDVGYTVNRVNAGSTAYEPEMYPNRRSELWFAAADRAYEMLIDISRIPESAQMLLKKQLLAVRYRVDKTGRRVAEDKDSLKKPDRLGRSPDDADAFNLLWAPTEDPTTARDLDAYS